MKTPGHFPSDPHAPTELSHDAPKDSLLGAQLGNYVIEGQLGRGGFGAVYKARDVKLDRSVALKFLLDTVQPDHLALFEREAKAIAALSKHGSIVQIHSWGEYDGKVYMALEFIDSSGEHLIRTYPEGLDAVKALRLIHSAAQGLAYAHGQGIYHRDIKPANILVDSQSGTAKLADFGLAKFAESLQGSILQGRISGSPPFMSPEQATGGLYDERSDIFSLGATLYNLLTGKLPYEGKTPSRVIEKVVKNQRVGLAERRSDLPESVVAIVDKAMAFTPADRYDSVEEMIAAIESALAELDAKPAPAAEGAPRKPMPVALIGVGVGVAVILAVLAVAFMMGGGGAADGPTAGVTTAQAPGPAPHLGGGSAPSETGASAHSGDTVQVTSKVVESASVPVPPAAEGKTPESIIRYYLESWRDGDYAAMYGALAAPVRQGMTFAEFEDALINDVRGPVARIESVDPEGDAEPREPAPNPFRTTGDEGASDSNPFAEGQQEESRPPAEPVARESAPWWYVDVAFSNGATGPQRLRTGVLKEGGGWRIGAGGLVPVDGGASLFRRPQL